MSEMETGTSLVGSLPVNTHDVESLKKQRSLLKTFVQSQLKEADFSDPESASYGEGDYGIIPGTKKRCLFKPGAEKLQKLFQLGSRFHLISQTVERKDNFAMFIYKCEVYHLPTGRVIAECEGACNSQEKKYKTRTTWVTKKVKGKNVRESVIEETPVCDIINTLMKMAQKRALVGATLLATGGSDYFTQDVLEPEDIASAQPSGPKENSPDTEPEADERAPQCCGREMMLSKYEDRDLGHKPWYCVKCQAKKPRVQGAA